ncbi:MAG: hypothetical protein M3R08_10605 [Bacteroidota bacterium]|nr:hypothetical protein [Bacteroidota bacterium]
MQTLRYIPTLTHALLDHLLGIVLIISPWIFEFHSAHGPAVHVPFILGGCVVINSLITKFEMGLLKWIPVRVHLIIDIVLGISLALSPWALDFSDRIFLPHLIGGMSIAIIPIFSVHKPFDESVYTEVVIREGRSEVVRYAARSADNSL